MTFILQIYQSECGHYHDALTTQHMSSIIDFHKRMSKIADVNMRIIQVLELDIDG